MTSSDAVEGARFPRWLVRFGSPRASVFAMILVAAVSGLGGVIEWRSGAATAHWQVFDTTWFLTILGVCGLHALAAVITRLPWRRRDLGPVLIYVAVAVLVAGQLQSQVLSVSGELVVREGESADHFVRPERTRITAVRQNQPDEAPYQFAFDGGPTNWPAGRTLDLGEVDGVSARVLHYYAHAWPVVEWIDASPETGGPSVRLNVTGPKGERLSEPQLIDDGLGEELFVGPMRIQLYRASGAGMLDDFLHPHTRSTEALGAHGVLLAFHGDSTTRIAVQNNVGRRIPLGASGVEVELVAYLPNARPDRLGKFSSVGDEPKNPVVELRVHEKPAANVVQESENEPLRQLAFAKSPLLNLDPVNRRPCPIKFRYYHPRIEPAPGVELIQDFAGRLHARVASGGQYRVLGAVSRGQKLEVSSGFSAELAEHRPYVMQRVSWRPTDAPLATNSPETNAQTESAAPTAASGRNGVMRRARSSATADMPRPAMEVEIRTEGVTHTTWFQRGQPGLNQTTVAAPQGPLAVVCEADRVPLGFTIELAGVEHPEDTASRRGMVSSQWKTVDADGRSRPPRTVAPNQPLPCGSYTFYQQDVQDVGHGKRTARLLVVSDPGRPFQYLGGLLALIGAVSTLAGYRRVDVAPVRRKTVQDESTAIETAPNTSHTGRWSAAATVLMCVTSGAVSSAHADAPTGHTADPVAHDHGRNSTTGPARYDWQAWRQLPVFEGERAKPLDTLAREFVPAVLAQSTARDPSTGETPEPVAVAMAMVFEWRGWDHPSIERLLLVKDTRGEYFQFHEPDRWDNSPLLRVDDVALRAALGLDDQDRSVSPAELSKLRVEAPNDHDSRRLPFPAWAMVASERARTGMPVTALERAGLELAERLWAYQDWRMGRYFDVLPDGAGKWKSLDWLALTPFDPSTDPSGQRRKAQQAFWAARRAYRAGDADGFTGSSRGLLWAIRHDSDQVAGYPSSRRVTWEIAARRWQPARVAWVLLAFALVAFMARGAVLRSVAARDTAAGNAAMSTVGDRAFAWCAFACYFGGVTAAVLAVGLRTVVAGHAPVTNAYEMLLLAGAAVTCLGAIIAWQTHSKGVLAAATVVAMLAIASADLGVGSLDATIRPADPITGSSVWFTVHVATSVIGYAVLALAWSMAVVHWVRSLFDRRRATPVRGPSASENRTELGQLLELVIGVGLGFSVAGLVSGGVWSDLAWGRFWNWSLQEVFALVGLFPHVGLLIARRHEWFGDRVRSWTAAANFLMLMVCVGAPYLLPMTG